MSCRRRPEERATPRPESRRRRGRGALLIAALLMFSTVPARSEDDKLLVQGPSTDASPGSSTAERTPESPAGSPVVQKAARHP